ncbi:IS4 family transposase [Tautonia plasticadhaerens]|uniref:Transposase for transposon Tn5 n=1 Tax=Tautonia plasticadhaerens TaxID=2527974 RepID=A0A518GZZ3_9BACT|nr:IS4 family transposase [Tautonia plasticadhaerens]QDV34154.1 Transposase for transposon Tn5 [Tautonia plasticadhaerens]
MKTGLGAERLQLETAGRLFAAVAIMGVVAWRLIALKERLRSDPEAPAERSGLDQLELEVLRRELGRPIGTVREVVLAAGRLGGHMNRKRDGMPGWQTLWIGMLRLRTLAEGVRLGRDLRFGE